MVTINEKVYLQNVNFAGGPDTLLARPKSPMQYKTEQLLQKDNKTKMNNTIEIRNSTDSSTKDSALVVSTSDSLSFRTSNSSKRDSITSDAVIRDSRTSSGILISDKPDEKKERKRERKVYTQSRQSERIRRNRLEIDGEPPFEFLSLPYNTGKRKRRTADNLVETPKSKIKKMDVTPLSKKGRKKIYR